MNTILSVEEKQLLEKRYEDLEFLDEIVDDLKCGRCHRLIVHHYFSQCGHAFCANCRRLLTDGPSHCPKCSAPIRHLAEQKVEFEQQIYAVKVRCPNKKYGCSLVTTLLLLSEHLRQCKDTQEAALPAELTLDEVTKSMLNKFEEMSKQINHVVNKMDQLEQKVSRLDASLEDVKGQIKSIFSEQSIDEIVGQKREMKNEIGSLKNKVEGQEQRLRVANQSILNTSLELRTNEEKTKKQEELLQMTIKQQNEKMRKLEQKMGQTKQLNSSVDKVNVEMEQNIELQMKRWNKDEKELRTLIDGDDDTLYNFFYCHKCEPTVLGSVVYRWTLKDINQLMKKKTFEYESEAFTLKGYPFLAKAKLMLKEDDKVYFAISFKDSSGPKWWSWGSNDIIPQLTCMLKDVKNKLEMKHKIRTYSYLFTSKLQYDTYYYDKELTHKSWLTHSNYNANDSVEILFLIEPPSVAFRLMSTDGSIVQRISHYQHRLQLAQGGLYYFHCSPYFSTKLNGYRVWVRMWLDGYGDFKGKGLAAEIIILCGEYDSQLAKSFKHKTTVTLMNQKDLGSCLIRSAEEDISVKQQYFINITTHKEIKDGGYILNNSLVYQINIQPN